MDVSCPRCKTEYEFDDARVPDSGVTVKCTSCNHVFRVRKKSAPTATTSQPAFVPTPKVGDETLPARSPQLQQPAVREWKVRQPSGNIFSFKELTTLQKWIVERKVSREDEISLTGEAWKRLGGIAELASFFQIVDDAKKVQELEALQQMKEKAPPAPPPPPPDDSFPRMQAQPPPEPPPKPHEAATRPPDDPKKKLLETLRDPGFNSLPPRSAEEKPAYKPPPLPVQQKREVLPDVGVEAETIRPDKKGGGAGMVLGLLLVLAGLGGAAGYYFVVYQPEQAREQEARDIEEKARAAAAEKLKQEEDARKEAERLAAEKKAAEEAEAKKKAEEAAAAAVPDAGPAAVVKKVPGGDDAPSGPLPDKLDKAEKVEKGDKPDKPAPKKSADYWISQGDRLRDKERAEAALDAYGKALDVSPENVEALTGKGLCFLDMAKPLQAEPVLEHALKVNPRYAPAIMGLAESYRFQGKKDSAIGMYQKYLDTFPNGPEAGVAKANIERLK
ncbi:MAG: zinc-ribbon domain-containing protein [Myxococcaceae bacterium]|nr:zinc-ribbon domain-containing protein [Myxococcaceae bacterium]